MTLSPWAAMPTVILLAACMPPPRNIANMDFMGSWDCGVTVMTFTPDSYLPSNDAKPIAVRRFWIEGNDTRITLADGAEISVQTRGGRALSWLSHSTGDMLECGRVTG